MNCASSARCNPAPTVPPYLLFWLAQFSPYIIFAWPTSAILLATILCKASSLAPRNSAGTSDLSTLIFRSKLYWRFQILIRAETCEVNWSIGIFSRAAAIACCDIFPLKYSDIKAAEFIISIWDSIEPLASLIDLAKSPVIVIANSFASCRDIPCDSAKETTLSRTLPIASFISRRACSCSYIETVPAILPLLNLFSSSRSLCNCNSSSSVTTSLILDNNASLSLSSTSRESFTSFHASSTAFWYLSTSVWIAFAFCLSMLSALMASFNCSCLAVNVSRLALSLSISIPYSLYILTSSSVASLCAFDSLLVFCNIANNPSTFLVALFASSPNRSDISTTSSSSSPNISKRDISIVIPVIIAVKGLVNIAAFMAVNAFFTLVMAALNTLWAKVPAFVASVFILWPMVFLCTAAVFAFSETVFAFSAAVFAPVAIEFCFSDIVFKSFCIVSTFLAAAPASVASVSSPFTSIRLSVASIFSWIAPIESMSPSSTAALNSSFKDWTDSRYLSFAAFFSS